MQGNKAKLENKTMKTQTTWQSCCILFSLAIAVAPVVQAAEQGKILYARAIGEEPTAPGAPEPGTKTPTPEKKTPAGPVAEKPSETKPGVSKAAIWAGIGIAALLALGGGGGGGGGGSSTPPHPPAAP